MYLDKIASTQRKKQATRVSIGTAIVLLLAKIGVFFFTSSLAILASAIDSLLDLLISLSNYFVVRQSEQDATDNFRFGFGRLEEVAGLFQGILITLIGVGIILGVLLGDYINHTVQSPDYILWMMGGSMAMTYWLTQFLKRAYEATHSSVLAADAAHYRADLYSNAGIFFGTLLLMATGWNQIDSIICLVLAALVVKDGGLIAFSSLQVLLDREIAPELSVQITDTIDTFIYEKRIAGYHALRTRKTGSKYFAEVHVVFKPDIMLKDAHILAHQLEDAMHQRLPRLEITLHLDAYNDEVEDRSRSNK